MLPTSDERQAELERIAAGPRASNADRAERDAGRFIRAWNADLSDDDPMTIERFAKRYGTKGLTLLIGEFIRRAPDFPGGEDLAKQLGTMLADLESALMDLTRR